MAKSEVLNGAGDFPGSTLIAVRGVHENLKQQRWAEPAQKKGEPLRKNPTISDSRWTDQSANSSSVN